MRFLFLLAIGFSAMAQQHCGFDFTSYVVVRVQDDSGKPVPGLKLMLIDRDQNPIINTNNRYSWTNKDQALVFIENYKINTVASESSSGYFKWYFPYATESYLLSVTNDMPAEDIQVYITDPAGKYEPAAVQLSPSDLYVLCVSQIEKSAMTFGKPRNKPIMVTLRQR
jgi:hypothetical protein